MLNHMRLWIQHASLLEEGRYNWCWHFPGVILLFGFDIVDFFRRLIPDIVISQTMLHSDQAELTFA